MVIECFVLLQRRRQETSSSRRASEATESRIMMGVVSEASLGLISRSVVPRWGVCGAVSTVPTITLPTSRPAICAAFRGSKIGLTYMMGQKSPTDFAHISAWWLFGNSILAWVGQAFKFRAFFLSLSTRMMNIYLFIHFSTNINLFKINFSDPNRHKMIMFTSKLTNDLREMCHII